MDDLMVRQREQLRALQNMVKTHSGDPEKAIQLNNMAQVRFFYRIVFMK